MCNHHAPDPRDKVFALLAIARESHIPHFYVADYTKSRGQIYTETKRFLISGIKHLDILSANREMRIRTPSFLGA
jgi:hypothetical protein